jgi:hypothetical protein
MAPFRVEKLSDEFGQYTLILTCSACHYERVTTPQTLGRLCGWDARRGRCRHENRYMGEQYCGERPDTDFGAGPYC